MVHVGREGLTRLEGSLQGLRSLTRLCSGFRKCSFAGQARVQLKGRVPDGQFWIRIAQPSPDDLCACVADLVVAAAKLRSRLFPPGHPEKATKTMGARVPKLSRPTGPPKPGWDIPQKPARAPQNTWDILHKPVRTLQNVRDLLQIEFSLPFVS
jgi:hypothetical protein